MMCRLATLTWNPIYNVSGQRKEHVTVPVHTPEMCLRYSVRDYTCTATRRRHKDLIPRPASEEVIDNGAAEHDVVS
jgi:hypothetical protein